MKNEKFESLLNKVVEYSKSEKLVSYEFCYKGFLYKDGGGYYIKIIETIYGNSEPDDIIYLNTNDEQYIKGSDKPKLMRISLKSWHYKLMKFVLRSKTPTPQTMQNGCPYFWLLIFSLFACTFVALWEVAKFIFMLIPDGFFWCLEKSVDAWLRNLDDVEAYEMENNRHRNGKNLQKLPVTAKILFDMDNDESFFDHFFNIKYGFNRNKKEDREKIDAKKKEIRAKWEIWKNKMDEKRAKRIAEEQKRYEKYAQRELERERLREARRLKWEERTEPIRDKFNAFFAAIHKAFTFKGDVKSLVKRTKQIAGAIITLLLLGITFFFVDAVALILMFVIDACIHAWVIFVVLGIAIVCVGILYILGVFVWGWIEKLINKYHVGKKVWYIEPLIYGLYYPIKYIIFAIGYFLLYVIWIPIKFIFYNFLWEIVLVNTGLFIWKLFRALGRGLANSTGVFGEYFSASYTDYCPGIEWVDVDEKE
jgi:hypothetical protein